MARGEDAGEGKARVFREEIREEKGWRWRWDWQKQTRSGMYSSACERHSICDQTVLLSALLACPAPTRLTGENAAAQPRRDLV